MKCLGTQANNTSFTDCSSFFYLQVPSLLGIKIPGHKGIGKFLRIWGEIFKEIPNTNFCDLTIFLCCFAFLCFIKEFINPRYAKKLPIPIPGEFLFYFLAMETGQMGLWVVWHCNLSIKCTTHNFKKILEILNNLDY